VFRENTVVSAHALTGFLRKFRQKPRTKISLDKRLLKW